MSEENVRKKIMLPWVAFDSDAGSYSDISKDIITPPRAFGSFARVLGKYVRDEKLISMEEAIRRLTGFSADNLGIKNRGYLKPGFFADIVVFDPELIEDKATFVGQDHSKATYAPKVQKTEGLIDWTSNAENIIGKINGLYPVPGAFFISSGERYKILKAEISNGIGNPGQVLNDYLEIACGNKQSIKVTEIQRQGKRPQNIGEFMLGSRIRKGHQI